MRDRAAMIAAANEGRMLPEFDRPPVIEVAASIQFEPVAGLDAARLGLLWSVYRTDYPHTEHHPPLRKEIERFGSPAPATIEISLDPNFPTPRLWFLNGRRTELVQVQQDRFALNWRNNDTGDPYPRYVNLSAKLAEEFERFEQFLDREGLGPLNINQVELTYVNHIPAGPAGGTRTPVERILTLWAGEVSGGRFPAAEDLSFQTRYVMSGPSGPAGRLHVRLQSQFRIADGTPLYTLHMVGRGAPESANLDGALALLDRAHCWIVDGFTAITTPAMHQTWGRTR